METPNFRNFQNENGDYTIVYDQNGENETIVGYTGKKSVADNSCRALNDILFLERERVKTLEDALVSNTVCVAPEHIKPCRHSFGTICQYNGNYNFKKTDC